MRLLLTTLGFPLFEKLVSQDFSGNGPVPVTYKCAGKGAASASGQYTPEGFVVFKGSTVRKQIVESMQSYPAFVARRQALIDGGKLVDTGLSFTLSEDLLFSSPSAAADMVLGRSANGWIEWVTDDGRTLDTVERKQQ